MSKLIDLAGRRFGHWSVIERGAEPAGHRGPRWVCVCDCGTRRSVEGPLLRAGRSKGCGCYSRAALGPRNLTHGHTAGGRTSPEYQAWQNLRSRCQNPKDKDFPQYGGRGIRVCDRWSADFAAFLSDMGPRPHWTSIDRIDANGNYSPDNCRWSSFKEQVANRRPFVNNAPSGENVWTAKLTWADVAAIRLLADKKSRTSLARRYGVSAANISAIVLGRTWVDKTFAEKLMPAAQVAA